MIDARLIRKGKGLGEIGNNCNKFIARQKRLAYKDCSTLFLQLGVEDSKWSSGLMTMPPDIANAVVRHDDCFHADPVFIALQKERDAFHAYSEVLTGLARLGAFSCEVPSDELLDLQEERLPELEAAEAKASASLMEAEQELLATKPISIEGAAALLEFLRKHLSEDPDINPVLESIGNIVDLLKGGQHGFVVPYNRGYL